MSKQLAFAIGGFVAEFAGDFPELDVPLDVDITELEKEGKAFFVTLPIIPAIGMVSANGLLYDDDLAATIEEQINVKRPGANFGHLPEAEQERAFPHPKAFWVAARRVGDTLWAKCYVPAGEAREHLRSLKAVGGKIATSIFGRGDFEKVSKGVQRLVNFALETVDFAPPERAALGYAAPVIVTAEMETDEEFYTWEIDEGVIRELESNVGNEVVTELAQVSDTLRQQIIAEYEAKSQTSRTIAELTTERDRVVLELDQARTQLKQMAVVEMRRTIKERVSEYVAWPVQDESAKADLTALRATVTEFVEAQMGENPDVAKAGAAVDVAWVRFKPIAELLRDKLAGPAAIVSAHVQEMSSNGVPKLEDTPENRAKASAAMGITV